MRDKFIFEPNDKVNSPAHRLRQADILKVLIANKGSRKKLEAIAHEQLAKDLRTATDEKAVHTGLNEYEKAHLNIGSWPRIKGSLKLRWRNLRIEEAGGVASLREKIGEVDELLGKIHLNHLRFVPLDPQPLGGSPVVYQRLNDTAGRHYIMLPASKPELPPVFVRRFVIRGLNGHNSMELDNKKPLTAAHRTKKVEAMANPQPQEIRTTEAPRKHNVPLSGSKLTETQQLLSHTRGWKKRYLSTGVGNKPPLSTRGTVFISLFGNVVIDLAKIPADSIFDLHSPTAAAMNLEVSPDLVVSQGTGYPATDYAGEAFLALRDVLRTRELLIKREVQLSAVIYKALGKKILGIGFGNKDDRMDTLKAALKTSGATLPIPQPQNTEPEDFLWGDGRRWFFALYASEMECQTAAEEAKSSYTDLKPYIKQINVYEYSPPLGMVLT